jgi:hypothetical protein
MNQRVPDSSGLPLRAMVMVLLFLGVIFLLVGFQAMSSGGNSDEDSSVPTVTTSTAASKTSATPQAEVEVRVYNISGEDGAAGRTADQLKADGYNVAEIGSLSLPDVEATTVYYTDAPGERDTADAVGKALNAPVEPRIPAIADQPPGVVVVVAG